MGIHLIPTKVIIPKRAPGVVRRPRLIEFLHENLGRKLLLVTAPAGYGKTTLLVDFASEAGLPVCWYTLDEGDRDPSMFLAHLVASIRQKFPKFGERSMSLTESGSLSARAAAAALVADMVNDIAEYFVLILDDWHSVGDDATIRDRLDQLLAYLPEHAHLIVAGRTLPRGPLVRLAAHSAVAGLGPNDLRFTPAEVRELLASRYDLQVTDDQANKLVEESEGWISGILLTSQAMWQGLLAGLIHAAGAPGALYDYLAGEVFDRLSPPLRRFLLESAVPRQFTVPLCDELRHVPGSDVWIEQAEARNLFLTRVVADGETWFRYHHLFREFLLARFKRDDVTGLARLHVRSGELFESRQQPEEAVEHYVAAGAPARAARVMDANARSLFHAGRTQTLLRWVDLLPTELHPTAPELTLFHGQTLIERGRSAEALPVLQQAEATFRVRGNAVGQIHARLSQGWAHHARGRLRDALEIGEEVLRRIRAEGVNAPLWEAQTLRLIGTVYISMGEWRSGEKYLTQVLALYRQSDSGERNTHDLARTVNDLANALRFMGRLEEAATLQAESLALWRRIGNPGPLAASLNNVGYDRFLAGDYTGALALYTEAWTKAEEAEDRRAQAGIMDGVASAYRDRGEFQRAIEIYAEAFGIASEIGDQWLVSWMLDGLGHAYRLAGNLDRALSLFEQSRSLAEREGIGAQVTLSMASIGIVRVEQGNVMDGLGDLERASNALRAKDSHLDLARVLFWLARAYHKHRQYSSARESLAEMMRLGSRLGGRPFSLAEGRRAMAFLVWGAEQFDSGSLLRVWLDGLRAKAAAPPREVKPEVVARPRVEVRAFGPGQVFRDGQPLAASDWGGSATGRELLFYLLERSPQRKEEIGAVFWPDLSPARMTNAFHNAKYRARHALGVEFVIFEDDRYRIDPAAGITYDVAEFERLLDSARRRSADDPERVTELQRAVALYTGDYLTGVYSDWANERRQALQSRYLDALNPLLDHLLRCREFEQALALCRRGLELDFYREELQRGILLSLAETGRRAEALAHYKLFVQRLRRELHAAPSQATRDLIDRIRAQR